jgi:multidrug efflux pump subunit AcrB
LPSSRCLFNARAAIQDAAVERFRLFIMTTFAMLFGMPPVALGLEVGGN